jgi:hypothetical protein
VSNLSLSSLKLKYGAWSKRTSDSGFCLHPSMPPKFESNPWQEQYNLTPEFDAAIPRGFALDKDKQYLLITIHSCKP